MRESDGGPNTRPRLPRLATAAPERQSGLQITVGSNCNAAQTKKVLSILHTVGHSVSQPASQSSSHPSLPEHEAEPRGSHCAWLRCMLVMGVVWAKVSHANPCSSIVAVICL